MKLARRANPTRDLVGSLLRRPISEQEGDPYEQWHALKMRHDKLKYALATAHGDMKGVAEKLLSLLDSESHRISRCDLLLQKSSSIPEAYQDSFTKALSRVVLKTGKVIDALSDEFAIDMGEGIVTDIQSSMRTKLKAFLNRLSVYYGEQDAALNDLETVFLNSHLD